MMNFQQFVGSITSESVRKQAYRKRTKQGHEWDIVPEERHLCDGETTNHRQSSDRQVTEQGQVDSSVVQTESQVNLTGIKEIDKEATSVPRPIFVRKEKVEGEDVEPVIFNKPKKLVKPRIEKNTKETQETKQ